jgi:hypothetical protein
VLELHFLIPAVNKQYAVSSCSFMMFSALGHPPLVLLIPHYRPDSACFSALHRCMMRVTECHAHSRAAGSHGFDYWCQRQPMSTQRRSRAALQHTCRELTEQFSQLQELREKLRRAVARKAGGRRKSFVRSRALTRGLRRGNSCLLSA